MCDKFLYQYPVRYQRIELTTRDIGIICLAISLLDKHVNDLPGAWKPDSWASINEYEKKNLVKRLTGGGDLKDVATLDTFIDVELLNNDQ